MSTSTKPCQCNIRISEGFMVQLQDCADKQGITVSEYIRFKMEGVVRRQRAIKAKTRQ